MLLLAAACGPGRDPGLSHKAFLPVVVRSRIPGHVPWETRVELTNPGGGPIEVRLLRWPPDEREAEIETLDLGPQAVRGVSLRIPFFPSVSSFFFESASPFSVRAVVRDRKSGGPSPLVVPAVDPEKLAREGDTLRVGPILSDREHRSHICFTFPATEREAVPFRVRTVVWGADGVRLGTWEQALHGVPQILEDPWAFYELRDRRPLFVEVTLLGGTRGRKPIWGLWVYGIVTETGTGASRFVETSVRRGS
ncbi:MAG: hypothetical protein ACHQPI_11790 [Thermoanaerobaculia bacterium]